MKTSSLDRSITYDGTQLKSHWILTEGALKGDAIVAFEGPCDVKLDHMVDLEDVLAKKNIYSEKMLHFIAEFFDNDLEKTILRQRLLMSVMQEELNDCLEEKKIIRKGDDLFWEHFKLTVSIATASPVSTLIHAGINIISDNTPVPTQGLNDFGLNPQAFARSVMNRFTHELEGVAWARAKVRAVL